MYCTRIPLLLLIISVVNGQDQFLRNVFDNDLYERVLDPQQCQEQLQFLLTNISSIPFYDAGVRFPRGLLTGNLQDWGNFHQCLQIQQQTDIGLIEGKYCSIDIPFQLNMAAGLPSWIDVNKNDWHLDEETINTLESFETIKRQLQPINGRSNPDSELGQMGLTLKLALCIPKVCTTNDVLEFARLIDEPLFNATERFCRLPNDKPFVAADYVAMVFCGVFLFLIIISTSYDLHYNVMNNRNRKDKTNTLCCSFSLYTNTKRLLTFNNSPDALNSIDGIRSIAMLWVVVGHVFSSIFEFISNQLDAVNWMISFESFWIMSAPITVDTFFLMSGLLLVYTTAEKLTRRKFLRNIHMFYILRYLRLFPILAAAVLFQASLAHHLSDGPTWHYAAYQVQACRDGWWWPLLYVQNYLNLDFGCLGVVWYLCVDMQLYWISPLVLVFVVGGRRCVAWLALGIALFLSLLSGSLFSFIYKFPSSFLGIRDMVEAENYFKWYYLNTLTRGGPFFVGMLFGYLLHVWRGRKVKIPKVYVALCWILALGLFAFNTLIIYPISQPEYGNRTFDGFFNSYARSLWALGLGWVIFACAHGYGGPVNWFLSLSMWKLPARLSYAMYLIHMPLIMMGLSSMVGLLNFSVAGLFYRFMADLVLTFIVSFALTLAIDSPFSTLQKLLLGDGPRKKIPPREINELTDSTNVLPEKSSTSIPEKIS